MQLIDSSERADMLFFKSAPEWDSNQLSFDYESEVQTTTLSIHITFIRLHQFKKALWVVWMALDIFKIVSIKHYQEVID